MKNNQNKICTNNTMSNKSSNIITSIYKSRQNLFTLVERSGFNVDEYKGSGITEINAMHLNNQLDMIFEKELDDKTIQKIYVRYNIIKTLSPPNINELVDDLLNNEEILTTNDILLIIIDGEINEPMQNTVKEIYNNHNMLVIIQNIKRLQFNIFESIYVSPHRIMDDIETQQLTHKYNLKLSELPSISRFDAVAQSIMIKPGQVCEIERRNKTTLTSKYYRMCVNI